MIVSAIVVYRVVLAYTTDVSGPQIGGKKWQSVQHTFVKSKANGDIAPVLVGEARMRRSN